MTKDGRSRHEITHASVSKWNSKRTEISTCKNPLSYERSRAARRLAGEETVAKHWRVHYAKYDPRKN